MAAPLTSMLITTVLLEKLTPEQQEIDNGKVNGFGVGANDVKHTKKLEKLSKLGKSKREKMSKT